MRIAGRWPAVLLLVGCLCLALLSVAVWRLVQQENALDQVRLRERLENTASLVIRESERALAQAGADERASISVRWDALGVCRSAGRPLLWSPKPPPAALPLRAVFEDGEDQEFKKADLEQAIRLYSALLATRDPGAQAGALLRIARCQRKLGRDADAVRTYIELSELKATPAGGAPAELVGHREAAVMLDASGDSAAATRERAKLQAILDQGSYSLDRETFLFYSQQLFIDPELIRWAEGVGELVAHAKEARSGQAMLTLRGQSFVAEWSHDARGGTGRLTDFDAVRKRAAEFLATLHADWQLLDTAGAASRNGLSGRSLERTAAQAGLPWGVRVSLSAPEAPSRALLLGWGALALTLAILATMYLAYRAARREHHVAQMQSEFVAAVSHEFRTPITALTHLTDMLESGDAAEGRKPLYYRALARETRRLREMVENLLDFGRIESGRYRYKPEDVNAVEFVTGILEDFRAQPLAESREVVFDSGSSIATITVDREAMRRAVWNLLDNAAKYSPTGSRITTHLSQNGRWTRVMVADEGPGIASEEQKRIFQKFVRGNSAGETIKGTGIGLAMVDAIARAHGGRVELLSRPGAGSSFTIVLPSAGAH